MSSSDDNSDAPPPISSDGPDLDTKLRLEREETRRQRLEQIQQRRQEDRRRQAEERKRRQLQHDLINQNDNGDDVDDNNASLGAVYNNYNKPSLATTLRKSSNSSIDARSSSNNSHDLLLSSPSPKVKFKSGLTKFEPSPSNSGMSVFSCLRNKSSSLQRCNNDAKTNSTRHKRLHKSTYAGGSDSSDDGDGDDMWNQYSKGGWSNAQRGGKSYAARSSSKVNNISYNPFEPTVKSVTTKAAAKRRSESDDSESSEDAVEAMKKLMRAKKEKAEAAAAAEFASATNGNSSGSSSHAHPPEKNRKSAEIAAMGSSSKRSPMKRYSYDTDDDDTDEDMASAVQQLRRESHAKRYKHNPIAMERREQEEREEQRRRNTSADSTTLKKGKLEGMEVMVGDDGETKSVSDMADDVRYARVGGGRARGGDAIGKMSWQTSREISKDRMGNDVNTSNGDEDDSPYSKRQCNFNQAARKMREDSDDDGLWDSSGSDDDKKAKTTTKKKPTKRKTARDDTVGNNNIGKRREYIMQKRSPRRTNRYQSNPASNGTSSSDDSAIRQRKKLALEKRRCRHSSSSSESDDNNTMHKKPSARSGVDDADQSDDASNIDSDRLTSQLKPDFADPKLGTPGPLVSFALSKTWKVGDSVIGCDDVDELDRGDDYPPMPDHPTNDGDIDHVPASINRYLKGYQRVGIQFIYSSVIHGKGCVLGDDMGLGKTVQCISLIAALLKKTGTGRDALELKEHVNRVKKALQDRDDSRHQALLSGFGLKPEAALESTVFPRFTPILIVVPSSVVENWQNEFNTWGYFNVSIYSGPVREKALQRIKDGLDFVLIAGKSLFVRAGDFEQLATVEWKLVIVDEFHEFKNGKSQGYMRLAEIRNHSGCPLIGMTGTLMQNRHDELFYLMDLVRPNLLGTWETFRDEISLPITYARAKDAKEEVLRLAEQRELVLRNAIKPAYLERKKEDVLKDSLMEKREKVVFCELTEIQKKIYRHIISLPDFMQLRFANAPCDCGINQAYFRGYKKMRTHKEQLNYQRRHKHELEPKKRCCFRCPWNPRRGEPGEPQIDPEAVLWIQSHEKLIRNPDEIAGEVLDGKYIPCQNCPTCTTLSAMHKLYKISSHPSLLQVDNFETGPDAKKKLEFAKVALTPDILRELPGGTYWKSDGIMDDHMKLSGKMKTLDYLLRRYLRKRNRVLVFSYSTASLNIIQNHIKCQGWTHLRLDGQTPTSQRQTLVDTFQNGDTEVFLISTKAGGLGLNLTAANKVIIFDVSWNPSCDEQAQDRAYRIGQKRNVDTVRLVARGTIEELMYARQVYKVQLKKQTLGHNPDGNNQPQIFRGVVNDPNRKGELFGLENLLKFKDGSFMSSLWKAADNPNQEHDINDLAKELDNMNEDQLDDLAEEGDEGPTDTRCSSKKNTCNSDADVSDDESDVEFIASGINHGDLFSKNKGRAQIAQGDDDFDEEMGGQSQVLEVATKIACERIKSDIEDEDEEDEGDSEDEEDEEAAGGKEEGKLAENSSALRYIADVGAECIATGKNGNDENSSSQKSPEQRKHESSENQFQDCSPFSIDGLRTQPTQTPTSTQKEPNTTRGTMAKVSLMGTVFETSITKDLQPATKHTTDLYIPSYSRRK